MLGRFRELDQHFGARQGAVGQRLDIERPAAAVRRAVQHGLVQGIDELGIGQPAIDVLALAGVEEGGGDGQQGRAPGQRPGPADQPVLVRQTVIGRVIQSGDGGGIVVADPQTLGQGRPADGPVLGRLGKDQHQILARAAVVQIHQPAVDAVRIAVAVERVQIQPVDELAIGQRAIAVDELGRGDEATRQLLDRHARFQRVQLDLEAERIGLPAKGRRIQPHQLGRIAVGVEGQGTVDKLGGLHARQGVIAALATARHRIKPRRRIAPVSALIDGDVITVPAVQRVIAQTARQAIIARAAVQGVRTGIAEQFVVARPAIQGRALEGQGHSRRAGERNVQRIGTAGRGRARHQRSAGAGRPLGHFDIEGAGSAEGIGQAGVSGRSIGGRGVIIDGQLDATAIENSQHSIKTGTVDIQRYLIARLDGDGIEFTTRSARRPPHRRVRNRRRVDDVVILQKIKGPRQGYSRTDAGVGRGLGLDHIRSRNLGRDAGVQAIVTTGAIDHIDTAAAADHIVACGAGQVVREGRADDLLDAVQRVVARRTRDRRSVHRDAAHRGRIVGDVIAVAAVQRVIAEPADQGVIALAAVQDVIAEPAVEGVIAGQAIDRVIAAQAIDRIGEGRAADRLIGDIAGHHQAAGRGRRDGLVRELQEFDIGDGVGAVRPDHRADLAVPGDGIGAAVTREDHRVDAQTAVDLVITAIAAQGVVARVAADLVGARTADGVLDHGAQRDGHIAHQTADTREGGLTQVDHLVLAVAREVKGVVARRVPDREDHVAVTIGLEPGLAGVGVEPIGGVAGTRRHIGAVQALRRRDIVHQGHGRILEEAGVPDPAHEVRPGLSLAEIAHQRILAAVLEIGGIGLIGDADAWPGVVVFRVQKADGVADLVGQHLIAVGVQHRRGVVAEAVIDPDIALGRARSGIAGQIGEGGRTRSPCAVVPEQDGGIVRVVATRVGHLLEGDARNIGPRLQSQQGGRDLGLGELREAVRSVRHGGWRRRPEGERHRGRGAQAATPEGIGARQLDARVNRSQRGLAIIAETAPVVSVQDGRDIAAVAAHVAQIGGAVEPSAAAAQPVAGDGAKGGVGVASGAVLNETA